MNRSFAIGLIIGASFVGAVSVGYAKAKGPAASVRGPDDLCTQVAPSGKARVTELARGNNAFLARLEMNPGGKVPKHRDPTEEYIHVLAGGGTLTIDGKAHKIGPGSTVFMPAGAEVHFDGDDTALSAIQVFAGPGPADKYKTWTGCR